MTSTPMDIDESPLTNAIPSLNITRTIPTTAAVSDVISIYRPTKVRCSL